MANVNINNRQTSEDKVNSKLFLDYIKTYGFNPDNYLNILELFQSAPCSISQFLEGHRQYLLSTRVKYPELEQVGIDGAYGYVDEAGVFIPKARFLSPYGKKIYQKHGNDVISLDDFDVVIGNGVSQSVENLVQFQNDMYMGFCMDCFDRRGVDAAFERYEDLVDIMNCESSSEYVLNQEVSNNKVLCLVRKK